MCKLNDMGEEKMEKQTTKDIMELFDMLSDHMQVAFAWAIKNLDLVKAICEDSEMSLEEIEHYLDVATKRKDYYLYTLVIFKKVYDEERRNQELDGNEENTP